MKNISLLNFGKIKQGDYVEIIPADIQKPQVKDILTFYHNK